MMIWREETENNSKWDNYLLLTLMADWVTGTEDASKLLIMIKQQIIVGDTPAQ